MRTLETFPIIMALSPQPRHAHFFKTAYRRQVAVRRRYENPADLNPTTTLADFTFTVEICAGSGAAKRSLWVGTASSREDNTTCSTCIETGRLPDAVAQAIVHEYAAEEGDESVSLICLVMVNSTGETAQLYAGSADEEDDDALFFEWCGPLALTDQWNEEIASSDVILRPFIAYGDGNGSNDGPGDGYSDGGADDQEHEGQLCGRATCCIDFSWMRRDDGEISDTSALQIVQMLESFIVYD